MLEENRIKLLKPKPIKFEYIVTNINTNEIFVFNKINDISLTIKCIPRGSLTRFLKTKIYKEFIIKNKTL